MLWRVSWALAQISCLILLAYDMRMIFYHTYETWTFYYAAIRRQHKIFSKIIERAINNHLAAGMPLMLARRKNVRIIKIYQRYKLSNTKYALIDLTSYTVRVGTSEWEIAFTVERIIRVWYFSNQTSVSYAYFIYHTRMNRTVDYRREMLNKIHGAVLLLSEILTNKFPGSQWSVYVRYRPGWMFVLGAGLCRRFHVWEHGRLLPLPMSPWLLRPWSCLPRSLLIYLLTYLFISRAQSTRFFRAEILN